MNHLLLLAVVLTAGCTAIRPPSPVSVYDLGSGTAQAPALTAHARAAPSRSVLVTTTSPVWLDSPAIRYRLAYHDSARIHVYAGSRWAGTPAVLLAQRIRDRIAAGRRLTLAPQEGVRADYALHLELEEFIQVFDAPGRSHAVVKIRASLVRPGARTLVAQRDFDVVESAREASAAGAAHALGGASEAVVRTLLDWLDHVLPEAEHEHG